MGSSPVNRQINCLHYKPRSKTTTALAPAIEKVHGHFGSMRFVAKGRKNRPQAMMRMARIHAAAPPPPGNAPPVVRLAVRRLYTPAAL